MNQSERTTRGRPKAVIFTHFGELKHDDLAIDDLIDKYTPIIKSYLECAHQGGNIGIVYGYVDWAVRKSIPKLGNGDAFTFDGELLRQELELIGVLGAAERRARKALRLSKSDPPRFHYLGLLQLVDLLNKLIEVDPRMPTLLCGAGGEFGYDSPKFLEAVIRLARGDIPHLAENPIIRIDEDAEVPAVAIDSLIDEFMEASESRGFYFFSGQYGRVDGDPDPVNNSAVRSHWFYHVGTMPGDPRFCDPKEPDFNEGNRLRETFLADLAQLGATQFLHSSAHHSEAMRKLLKAGHLKEAVARRGPQVISGAGLIMSRRAVSLLPPFMNFRELTTWVDDHMKRRLHEMLGDVRPEHLEALPQATVQQNRHRFGITEGDYTWASAKYFDRLMRGCVFHAMITAPDGSSTTYSDVVRDIAWGRITRKTQIGVKTLKKEIRTLGETRCEHVLRSWSSREFRGNRCLSEWVRERQRHPRKKTTLCNAVVSDAMDYLDLLLSWPVFVRTIERLSFHGNDWLYEPAE